MFKIMKEETSNYLTNLVPKCKPAIRSRNNRTYSCRTDCFKYSFFPSTLNDWFNLDFNIKIQSLLFSFIRPVQKNISNIFDPKVFVFLTRLRLGLSHLNSFASNTPILYPRRHQEILLLPDEKQKVEKVQLGTNGLINKDFNTIFKTESLMFV